MSDEPRTTQQLRNELAETRRRLEDLERSLAMQRQETEALLESQAKYQAIVKAFEGLIYVCSEDYAVEFMNERFIARTGHDATGEKCYRALHNLDHVCDWCVNEKVFRGETVRWELQSPLDKRWYYVVNTPLRHADGSLSKMAMIMDITEFKKAQAALQQAHDQLERRVGQRTVDLESMNEKLIQEIRERERTEQALRESEERYRLLTQHSLVGIYIHQDGVFVYANDRLGELVGCSAEEMIGKRVLDFVHPDDRLRVLGSQGSATKGGTQFPQYELRLLRKDGTVRWVEVLTTVIEYRGRKAHMGNVADIAERRRIQEDLIRKIQTIDELYEHILQSGKAKAIAEHTAEVAHELRQPLAIIGGFVRRVNRGTGSQVSAERREDQEAFDIVLKEVSRLERILGGLIDFSRRESVGLQPVCPNDIIQYVLRINAERMQEKELHVEDVLRPEVGEILLDPERFQQVVRNLVANAIEACPKGGTIRVTTTLSLPTEKVRRTGKLDSKAYFEMKIQNDGAAIPADELERIFKPFHTTKGDGTGIGLTLATRIIEDHKGSISVKSDAGATVFTVWLPADNAAPETIRDPRLTILIIDDMQPLLTMFKEGLSREGYEVLTAASGSKGLAMFRSHTVDVVVCHLGMPDMNGWRVGEEVKSFCEEQGIPKPPFLLIAGWGQGPYEEEEMASSGVDEIVTKPVEVNKLVGIIRRLVTGGGEGES